VAFECGINNGSLSKDIFFIAAFPVLFQQTHNGN
jgi:hypothetical protein